MKQNLNQSKQRTLPERSPRKPKLSKGGGRKVQKRPSRYDATLRQGCSFLQPRYLVLLIDEEACERLLWLTAIPNKGDYIDEAWWPRVKVDTSFSGSYEVLAVHHCPPESHIIPQPHVYLDVVRRSSDAVYHSIFGRII